MASSFLRTDVDEEDDDVFLAEMIYLIHGGMPTSVDFDFALLPSFSANIRLSTHPPHVKYGISAARFLFTSCRRWMICVVRLYLLALLLAPLLPPPASEGGRPADDTPPPALCRNAKVLPRCELLKASLPRVSLPTHCPASPGDALGAPQPQIHPPHISRHLTHCTYSRYSLGNTYSG